MMGMSNNWGIPDLSTFTENMIVNHLIFRLQKKLYYIYNMGIYIYQCGLNGASLSLTH
jgi:hypothetical protein